MDLVMDLILQNTKQFFGKDAICGVKWEDAIFVPPLGSSPHKKKISNTTPTPLTIYEKMARYAETIVVVMRWMVLIVLVALAVADGIEMFLDGEVAGDDGRDDDAGEDDAREAGEDEHDVFAMMMTLLGMHEVGELISLAVFEVCAWIHRHRVSRDDDEDEEADSQNTPLQTPTRVFMHACPDDIEGNRGAATATETYDANTSRVFATREEGKNQTMMVISGAVQPKKSTLIVSREGLLNLGPCARAELHKSLDMIVETTVHVYPPELVAEAVSRASNIILALYTCGEAGVPVGDDGCWPALVLATLEHVAVTEWKEADPNDNKDRFFAFNLAQLAFGSMIMEYCAPRDRSLQNRIGPVIAAQRALARLDADSYKRAGSNYLVFQALASLHGIHGELYVEATLNFLRAAEDFHFAVYDSSLAAEAAINLAVARATTNSPQTGEEDENDDDVSIGSNVCDDQDDEGRRRPRGPPTSSEPVDALRRCMDDMESARWRSRIHLGSDSGTVYVVVKGDSAVEEEERVRDAALMF